VSEAQLGFQGDLAGQPDRGGAWNGGGLVEDVVPHPHGARWLLGDGFRDGGAYDVDLFRLRESWLHGAQLLKRANHQASTDQQHERERDLHDDERVARPMAFAGLAEGAADGPQRSGGGGRGVSRRGGFGGAPREQRS